MRHSSGRGRRRSLSLGIAVGAAVATGVAGAGALAQTAPLSLAPAQPQAAPVRQATAETPIPPKPIGTPAKPAAAQAAPPVQTAPATTGSATPQKPKPAKPAPVRQAAAPGAPAPAAGTKPAKTVSPAQKVPASARLAAAIAAKTAQPVPPVHEHVSKPYAEACTNPDALGVSRVLEVDTKDGLYLGQLYSGKLPLEPKEVVLTFDDGPVPRNTERVLQALQKECVKATYFIVGQMAKAYPEELRRVAAAGHTIGYHTMTHPLDMVKRPLDWAKDNITSGWRTVDTILYGQAGDKPATPFFRYPGLFNSRTINEWLNGLNIGVFAADATGNDWVRGYDAPKVMEFALKDLDRAGNSGILLLHDTKDSTATMMPQLLRELKARGYKVVHLVPKEKPPALSGHSVAGVIPQPTAAPVAERTVAGFDAGRQLAENAQGRTGRTTSEPLPAYDSNAVKAVTSAAPTSSAPSDEGWFASTAGAFRGFGSAIGLW
ncbi:polysaccharide deacetylase family protein [Prosthecomicrobium sp. N25]|uniref:polysaccharide deacetylase family protein n=1 Tax=Prosthecomicrobium sp. N25 TaxID=3129254 RepID=UPI0030779A03